MTQNSCLSGTGTFSFSSMINESSMSAFRQKNLQFPYTNGRLNFDPSARSQQRKNQVAGLNCRTSVVLLEHAQTTQL
jgi:hypothetical protein